MSKTWTSGALREYLYHVIITEDMYCTVSAAAEHSFGTLS